MFFYLDGTQWPSKRFYVLVKLPKKQKSSQKFAPSILPKNLNKPPVRLKSANST
jgi:hypothetical protein